MGRVAEFALTQIKALQRTPGAPMPRPAQCQLVKRIAGHGVAAQAGVAPKDFLAAVDGQPASRLSPRLYMTHVAQRTYSFYSRPRHESIEVVTSGIDVGVIVEPTTPAIRATYNPKNNDPTALEILWAGRDFEALEDLSAKTLQDGRERGSPALLFHGASLYESGRLDAGAGEILEYLSKYGSNWTMNFGGIARYYVGLEARRRGREAEALEIWKEAFQYHPVDRMAELIEKATGQRPSPPASVWLQRRFPVDSAYPSFDVPEPQTLSLADALAPMSNDQLFAVCLLATYRSNGPYADFLLRWNNYATFLHPFFAGLHVLTSRKERYPDREYHYEREAEVRKLGLPFHLLHEHDEQVMMTVLPPGSPAIFLLDRTGTVVYQGDLDSVDVWDALASVSA